MIFLVSIKLVLVFVIQYYYFQYFKYFSLKCLLFIQRLFLFDFIELLNKKYILKIYLFWLIEDLFDSQHKNYLLYSLLTTFRRYNKQGRGTTSRQGGLTLKIYKIRGEVRFSRRNFLGGYTTPSHPPLPNTFSGQHWL
jgi:hypothetical protein